MFKDLIEVVRQAGANAELAERTYRDGEFRAELRMAPEVALARFALGTFVPAAPLREIPATWRFRMKPRRARRAA